MILGMSCKVKRTRKRKRMDSDVFGAFEEGIKSLQLSKWVFASWFKTKLLWSFVVGGGMGGRWAEKFIEGTFYAVNRSVGAKHVVCG